MRRRIGFFLAVASVAAVTVPQMASADAIVFNYGQCVSASPGFPSEDLSQPGIGPLTVVVNDQQAFSQGPFRSSGTEHLPFINIEMSCPNAH